MKLNDIVRWSFRDVDGLVEYVGTVVNLTEDRVEIEVEDVGIMGANILDGKFVVIGEAKAKRKKKAAAPVVPVKVAKKVTKPAKAKRVVNRVVNGQSNKALAMAIYRDLVTKHGGHPTRSVVVQALIKEAGFQKNTASTYQHNCKTKWCV